MDNMERVKELRVLYVEDEVLTRQAFEKILQRRVKELFIAENGKDGLEKFIEKSPDVIITDIEMPIMNGIIMIEEIKKIAPSKPIIILTAFEDDEHHTSLAEYKLIKPVDKLKLLDTLIKASRNVE